MIVDNLQEALKQFTDCPDWHRFLHDQDCTDPGTDEDNEDDVPNYRPDGSTCVCDGPYRITLVKKAQANRETVMTQTTVWEVEGDFGNVGGGRTIGIFATQEEALANAKGCGSLDCGGDGIVRLRHAVVQDGKYYLLQDYHPLTLGELGWSGAIDNHSEKNSKLALVALKSDTIQSKITTIRVLRGKLNVGLYEAKKIVDNLPHIFELSYSGRHELKSALEEIGDVVEELIDAED